jgi:hypothetical protein
MFFWWTCAFLEDNKEILNQNMNTIQITTKIYDTKNAQFELSTKDVINKLLTLKPPMIVQLSIL